MGKKKSVVLMVILTIVIVALCAITVFPAFPLPWTDGVQKWNPAVLQYDVGAELGGGYYTYYYPEGVISESEYKNDVKALTDSVNAVPDTDTEEKQKRQDALDEYVESYMQHKGLYLSKNDDFNIYTSKTADNITDDFKAAFKAASQEIIARYEKKGYADYRVSVVDDYAMRIELPKSDDNANLSFSYLSATGKITLAKGGEVLPDIEEGVAVSTYIKKVSVATKYKQAFLKIKFTDAGKALINGFKNELTESSAGSDSATTLDIKIGDQTIVSIYKDSLMEDGFKNLEARVLPVEEAYKNRVETVKILLDSSLKTGGFDVEFNIPNNPNDFSNQIRTFEPIYGNNMLDLLYIALGLILLTLIVLPIVKMGRYGGVSAYTTASYLIVTGLCFAFITNGIFEITLGSVLVFMAGLALVNALQYYIYCAMKGEFDAGKTVVSSVKSGYKKTLWTIVDIYAVLLLSALALLVGAGGLHTMAIQAIICIVTGAFCNLLWARFINFTFLSASKDKYKYFRFVREEDDDDE